MAQAVFDNLVIEAGLNARILTDSAGTSSFHKGEDPDYRTLQVVHDKGLSLFHKARQVIEKDFSEFDYLIPMDSSNMIELITQYPSHAAAMGDKLVLMRDFDPEGKERDVPDPYWGGKDGFEDVFRILERSGRELLSHLIEKELT